MAESISQIPWPLTMPSPDPSDDFLDLLDADSHREPAKPVKASEAGCGPFHARLAIHTLNQHQSQETDMGKLQQWIATETLPTPDDLQQATTSLRAMARLSELSNVDSLLALRADDGSYRAVVPLSLVEEVIAEAHQGHGTANEGVQKVLRRLFPSFYWPRMKGDVHSHLVLARFVTGTTTPRSANEQH